MHRISAVLGVFVFAAVLAACGNATTSSQNNHAGMASTASSTSTTASVSMKLNDRQFLAMMIMHHQTAIDMAQIALQRGEHAELKSLAQNIISTQQQEIDRMHAWQREWFGGDQATVMAGVAGAHAGMNMDMGADLEALKTTSLFDRAFIDAMIPHHEGAIEMARAILQTTQRVELKRLADEIVTAQSGEIDQMRQWREAWYGR